MIYEIDGKFEVPVERQPQYVSFAHFLAENDRQMLCGIGNGQPFLEVE